MAPDDPDPELAAATDELFGLDPGDFVPARNELARRLRADGDRPLAGRVARLRRPSPAAWTVNQLVRRHRADLDDLLRLGEELRATQSRTLGGADAAELRRASRARRDAVARLTDVALSLLAERGTGTGAHQAEVAATLEAASLDPEAAVEVSTGRLTSSLEPPSGFGGLAADLGVGFELVGRAEREDREPPESGPSAAGAADADVGALAHAERAVAAARRVATERTATMHELASFAAERHRHVQAAEDEASRALRALDEARRAADAADEEAGKARQAAEQAEAAAAGAAEAAERLRDR